MMVFSTNVCIYMKVIGILQAPEMQTQTQMLDVNRPKDVFFIKTFLKYGFS